MMIEKSISESTVSPNDLAVRDLGDQVYEIVKNENIESFTRDAEDGSQEAMYRCDKTILRREIKTREDAIVAFIRLRYTINDEYALTNKGIEDSANPEYVAYREYVAWCKEQAGVYFGELN